MIKVDIKLYSNKCPKCKILHNKLRDNMIGFKLIENIDEVLKKANELGVREMPLTTVNGEYKTYLEMIKLIKEWT